MGNILRKLKLRGRTPDTKQRSLDFGPWWWHGTGRGKEWIESIRKGVIFQFFEEDWHIDKDIEAERDD